MNERKEPAKSQHQPKQRFRDNSHSLTFPSDIKTYAAPNTKPCENAPLPVLAAANPNWASAGANNARAPPKSKCLNPWGMGANCGVPYPLDYGASIWGSACRGAGAGCAPTSSLSNCGGGGTSRRLSLLSPRAHAVMDQEGGAQHASSVVAGVSSSRATTQRGSPSPRGGSLHRTRSSPKQGSHRRLQPYSAGKDHKKTH